MSGFKGSSGKCYQLRANKVKLSRLKLRALERKEREVSGLCACGGDVGCEETGLVMGHAALMPFTALLLHFQACQVHAAGAAARLAPLCFGQRCFCLDSAAGMVAPALTSLGSAGLLLFLLQKQLGCTGARMGAGQGGIEPSGLFSALGI